MKAGAAPLLAAFLVAAPAHAQPQRSEGELEKVEQQLEARRADERRLKNEVEAREKEVASLRYQLVETANSLQDAERRIAEIADDLAAIDSEANGLEANLAADQAVLGDVLAALQAMELSRPPALFVSPEDANKAARAAILLSDAAPAIRLRAEALRTDLERLATLRAERDRERRAFEKTNKEIASRREVLADLLVRKQEERDVAAGLAAAAQRETAALAARATSLRGVLDRLERLARSITPRIKPAAPERGGPAPAPSAKPERADPFKPLQPFANARGALRPPVIGRIVGRFGDRRPDGARFEGVRFAVRGDGIVTSPFEGKIAFARAWDPIGNLLVLDVGAGYHILLMGVSAFLVDEGQKVAAGEPVGAMTGTGGSLDMEIRKNGEPVNPALWLKRETDADSGP